MEKINSQFQIDDVVRHKDSEDPLVIRNNFDKSYVNFRSEDYLLVCKAEDRKDIEQ